MSTALRTLRGLKVLRAPARALSTTARRAEAKTEQPSPTRKAPADVEADPATLNQQAPNRIDVWARGQAQRTKAMTGPRFEQTEPTMQVGFAPRSRRGAGDLEGKKVDGKEERALELGDRGLGTRELGGLDNQM